MKPLLFKIERFVLKGIRKICFHGKTRPKHAELIPGHELNEYIRNSLLSDEPFMIARFGSIELDAALYPYLLSKSLLNRYMLFLRNKISFIHNDDKYASRLIGPLCNNAGFFPEDIKLIDRFSKRMISDIPLMDCCCCCSWENEDLFNDIFDKNIIFGKLEDMEPYDYSEPWSKTLEGKKVLVVHPFAQSIESQYAKRRLLWQDNNVLPDFELITIKAVQTIAGEKAPFDSWFEALEHMESLMDAIKYDVAIVGCGAYGFHLAAHAKRTGHQAIHLGGATQILFGIKGKRWDVIPAVSKFYNDSWIYPLPEETPKNNSRVEGGCYW